MLPKRTKQTKQHRINWGNDTRVIISLSADAKNPQKQIIRIYFAGRL